MKLLSTSTILDVDLSLSSTTELYGPEPLQESSAKQNKPDMNHKGMMHNHLCIYILLN